MALRRGVQTRRRGIERCARRSNGAIASSRPSLVDCSRSVGLSRGLVARVRRGRGGRIVGAGALVGVARVVARRCGRAWRRDAIPNARNAARIRGRATRSRKVDRLRERHAAEFLRLAEATAPCSSARARSAARHDSTSSSTTSSRAAMDVRTGRGDVACDSASRCRGTGNSTATRSKDVRGSRPRSRCRPTAMPVLARRDCWQQLDSPECRANTNGWRTWRRRASRSPVVGDDRTAIADSLSQIGNARYFRGRTSTMPASPRPRVSKSGGARRHRRTRRFVEQPRQRRAGARRERCRRSLLP